VRQLDRKDFIFMAYKNANERTCVTTSLTKEQKDFLDSYSAYMGMSKAAFMASLIDEFRGRPEVRSHYSKIRNLEREIRRDQDQDQDQEG